MTARVRTLDEARASRTSLPDPGPDPWDQPNPLDVGHVSDWARVDTAPGPEATHE